jgi:hypothetical protein
MISILLHNIGSKSGRYTINNARIDKIDGNVLITIDDGYLSVYMNLISKIDLIKYLLFLPAAKMSGVNDWDQSGELAGQPIMSWENAIELNKLGARVGAHGLNHLDLTKLSDRELERELKESKRLIEEKLNVLVNSMAYPFGYFNQRVIDFAKAAGYTEAYTSCDSVLQGRGNSYRKRRIEIKGTDSDPMLRLKLSVFYDAKAAWELPRLSVEKMNTMFWTRIWK